MMTVSGCIRLMISIPKNWKSDENSLEIIGKVTGIF